MANKPGHRRFGNIRQRSSGRWQARYLGPDGRLRSAPQTFARKEEADRWLTLAEAQMIRGEWIDPTHGRILFSAYAEQWIIERPRLRPRTIELYDLLLRRHINPKLGNVEIGRLTTPMIRSWRAALIKGGASESMAAKAYRLVRAILNTAVKEDELIRSNPCRIPGADRESPAERPVLTVAQVFALIQAMPERYRALVALSTFACLRWGEAAALTRADLDLSARTVSVTKAASELRGSVLVTGPTKSRAGVRTVSFPSIVVPILREHLAEFVDDSPDALVFTGGAGRQLRRSNFRGASRWKAASEAIGMPGLHFHDLRHTGNTLASQTGVSTKDLMARMGHDSPRAALIYQHATSTADRAVADALDALVKARHDEAERASRGESPTPDPDDEDGAAGVLVVA
jgi:integrase